MEKGQSMNDEDRTRAIAQLDVLRETLSTHRPTPAEVEPPAPVTSLTIRGTLTREPEIRYTREGIAQCQLNVETSAGAYDVVAMRDLAENIALSLCKGQNVVVFGRLVTRTWQDDQDETQSRVEIDAHDIGPSLRWATVDVHKVERRPATV